MTSIHWASAIDGRFKRAADWSDGVAPGASDDAVLDAAGSRFEVLAGGRETVGDVQLAANATLSITSGTFTAIGGTGPGANWGVIAVRDGANLVVGGAVANDGAITLNGHGDSTNLVVATDTTLTGDGDVVLSDNPSNGVIGARGARVKLVNEDNTISGAGVIAPDRRLMFVNRAFGVIDADSSVNNLTIGPATGTGSVVNDGLIEATGRQIGIGVIIENSTVTGRGGTIFAGTFATAQLVNATVSGQALDTGHYGGIELDDCGVSVSGDLSNAGEIDCQSTSQLVFGGDTTLTGGGELRIGGSATGGTSPSMLTNVDNVIYGVGAGVLGSAALTLINDAAGTITGPGLLIKTGGHTIANAGLILSKVELGVSSPILNSGTIDASYSGTTGATLTVGGAIQNEGTLEAVGGTLTVNGAVTNDGLLSTGYGYLTLGKIKINGNVTNSGTILSHFGILAIDGDVDNTGTMTVNSYTLSVSGAVTGDGSVQIGYGLMDFASGFNENVAFIGGIGTLELAQSQGYASQVSGFSSSGSTTLDLGDIGFVSAAEATFSGTAASGVLSVSDGVHTANITLVGDYLTTTFVASSDGNGGTSVIGKTGAGASPPHGFVAAMSSLGGGAGGAAVSTHAPPIREALLVKPHGAMT
jgi:hypothetical protein